MRRRRTAEKARLREGTEAHYRDASYYDHAYGRRKDDVAHYTRLAKKHGSPVLELGVGTGRVAESIAKAGLDVVGIDTMPSMLARARDRISRAAPEVASRVSLDRGDLRSLRLKRKFPLVISPFNVFMHLYSREDLEAALETVSRHLAVDGRFAFDVLMPDPDALARDPAKLYRCGTVKPPGRDRMRYSEAFDYDPISQVQHVSMVFEPDDEHAAPDIQRLSHRQFYPRELEALLHYNGFAIEKLYGGFLREPFDAAAESQVVVAKRR